MAADKIIFGDMTPNEIEDFEKKIEGLIIHNASGGLNSLVISPSNNQLVIQADKIEEKKETDFPNLIFLSEIDMIRLYNYLGDFFIKRPNVFEFKTPKNEN